MNEYTDYYYIAIVGDTHYKLTYTAYVKFMNDHCCQVFKVLKKDFNALYKVRKNTKWVFNKLHQERKTKGAY